MVAKKSREDGEELKPLTKLELYEKIQATLRDNTSDTNSCRKAYEAVIKLIESSELHKDDDNTSRPPLSI